MPTRVVMAFAEFIREMAKLPHVGEEFIAIELDDQCFNAFCDELESATDRTGLRQMTDGVAYQPRPTFKFGKVTFYCGPAVPYPPVEAPPASVPAVKPQRLKAIAKPQRDVLQVATPPADDPPLAGSRRALRRRHAG